MAELDNDKTKDEGVDEVIDTEITMPVGSDIFSQLSIPADQKGRIAAAFKPVIDHYIGMRWLPSEVTNKLKLLSGISLRDFLTNEKLEFGNKKIRSNFNGIFGTVSDNKMFLAYLYELTHDSNVSIIVRNSGWFSKEGKITREVEFKTYAAWLVENEIETEA